LIEELKERERGREREREEKIKSIYNKHNMHC